MAEQQTPTANTGQDRLIPAAKRWAFMDVLNVIAICAVLLLHVSLNIFGNAGGRAWDVALVYQCVAIFAVPVFFMVSGANLLGYRERYSTGTFFKKRALRVVVTLVVWSAIVYVLLCFASGLFGYAPRRFGIIEFVKELLTDNVISIYWFFYVIIGLYIVTPIFSLIAQNRRVLGYTILLAAVLTFIIPTAEAFMPTEVHAVIDPYTLNFFTWSLTYYLLGYYLTHYVDRRLSTGLLVGVAIACVAVMFVSTYAINAGHQPDAYNNVFAKAEGIFTLPYAAALFLLFKNAEESLAKSPRYHVWRTLSAMSLTVYAVHMLFIWIFDVHVLGHVAAGSAGALALQFIVEPVVVYAASLAVAFAIQAVKRAIKCRGRKPNAQTL